MTTATKLFGTTEVARMTTPPSNWRHDPRTVRDEPTGLMLTPVEARVLTAVRAAKGPVSGRALRRDLGGRPDLVLRRFVRWGLLDGRYRPIPGAVLCPPVRAIVSERRKPIAAFRCDTPADPPKYVVEELERSRDAVRAARPDDTGGYLAEWRRSVKGTATS